jgi:hypothetical protein
MEREKGTALTGIQCDEKYGFAVFPIRNKQENRNGLGGKNLLTNGKKKTVLFTLLYK